MEIPHQNETPLPHDDQSLEEAAQEALMRLLTGAPVNFEPQLLPFIVSLACSDSPARNPRSGQTNSQVALGSSLVDRAAAVLSLTKLDEVNLLDIIDALSSESEEFPPLFVLRALFAHPSCTQRVKIRFTLKYVKKTTPRVAPIGWKLVSEEAGPYARAAALLASSVTNSNSAWRERLVMEVGMLPTSTFELFATLLKDRSKDMVGNQMPSLGDVSEALLSAKRLDDD